MPVKDAPTRPSGHVTTAAGYMSSWGGGWDELEHVTDLQWPLSVRTYARMRHDPTLTSVLAAYGLPILRARWAIDPRGVEPRIAKLCADSLGLPLLGKDKPGPVRRRGVQWIDHLRTALGSMTFGHACFEPVYDTSSGSALLASLAERPQLSLAEIEVDDQGRLTEITQYGDSSRPNPDPILADRILWYCRNREGANWTGQSILRSAFGAWLLKQDALRTHSTGLRRFAAGTPSVEWAPGTAPTEAQMASAGRAAAAVRVSDSGHVQMPPGASLHIRGVEGSFPDGLPFIRYLDEQMARSALTSLLDLGSTANGSRALGDTFADLLAAAVQATADTLAETTTELCVKLTDYNAGVDAPAPRVVVSQVAEDPQALAESIARLIQAGAIVRDDDIESWLRDAYGAPGKAAPTPAPAPQPPVPPVPPVPVQEGPAPDVPPVPGPGEPPPADQQVQQQKGKPEVARAVTAADPTPVAQQRDLTPAEKAAGLDPQAIDDAHGAVLAALLAAWVAVQAAQRASLLAQIAVAASAAALAVLTVDSRDAAEILGAAMLEAADRGAALAAAEAAHQGVTLPTLPEVDTHRVQDTAAALAEVMGRQTSATAAREALRLAGDGTDTEVLAENVRTYLESLSDTWVTDQLGAAVTDGINTGRAAVLTAGPAVRWVASEVLDRATCGPCREIDGHEYASWEDAAAAYPTGGYRSCLGRLRCRGVLYSLYGDEMLDEARGGPIPGVEPVKVATR